jgi:tRNA1Val (adenine37-N6)-methyltransferase
MAQKFPGALIEAVEYDPASAKQAEENIKSSPWKERMIVFNNRIQDYAVNIKNKYDLIICNTPYYEDHLKSASYKKNLAKHDHKLSLTELSEIIPILLKNSGYFYTILPPFSFEKFNTDMINKGYRLQDKLKIYNDHSKSLYRILGGFGKMPVQMKKKTLVIYDDTGQYTNEYKSLLKDYYLAF